ncbi:hypothetical protein ABLB69_08085 [Xenorhabdus khoisanae]|uniref:hypothetical protein n=1 Tax=Xenorhabdus khoisanae TaxID=880157 RepID=UPI0032B72645
MSTSNKTERVLLDLISKLGPLEWKRYQQRYPDMWMNGHFEPTDHSSYPPFTSFRFKNEDPKIIKILEYALASYKGKYQWVMISQKKEYGTGINRCILTKYIKELRENTDEIHKVDEYVARHEPDFGPLAYDDLINLTEHVKTVLNASGIHV